MPAGSAKPANNLGIFFTFLGAFWSPWPNKTDIFTDSSMRRTSCPEKGGMAMWRRHFSLFGGLFIFLFSIGFCVYIWNSVLTRGIYWPKASFLFPFFGGLGLSMMCYPVKPDAGPGQDRGDAVKWKNLPIGQKVIILTGAAIGLLQLTYFNGYWSI